MAEGDNFEHFQVLLRADGTPWELGRGAMGVTYKAFDTNLRCDVALKVINPQYLSSETARQRFLREARAAAQLRHPNVATVFHLGKCENGFFYAMEYVDGETVEARVRREGPLKPEFALKITSQVARALIAADRQKVVHRDIKPSNIMLVHEPDEQQLLVKVIDFGLAKSIGASSEKSITVSLGGFVGTPHFASPEQLEERETDTRSDIYSLGATLWYMLAGRPPFQGSLASVIHQHLGSELPAEVLLSFPPKVASLLQRMLAKRPEDRFQTPVELKQTLDELSADTDTSGPGESSGAAPGMTSTRGSSQGYATGLVIKNRYEILGQAYSGFFKAKDLQTNRIVGLKPIAGVFDTQHSEDARAEVGRLRNIHHPNLTAVHGLEFTDVGFVVITEWSDGITLLDLLRARRELRWSETLRVVQPLAKLLDFLVDRDLLHGSVALKDVNIEPAHPNEDLDALRRTPVDAWPPFLVKVDILATTGLLSGGLPQPAETMVRPVAPSVHLKNPVQPLARLIYELLGGVGHEESSDGSVRFTPVTALSEAGNAILRPGVVEPAQFPSAVEFLADLERAESVNLSTPQPTRKVPPQIPSVPATSGEAIASEPDEEELGAEASPWLLRLVTIAVALFSLGTLAAVLGVSFLFRKETTVAKPPAGFVTLDSKPTGAAVRWNGQEIGSTPLTSYQIPVGKQTLELQSPGYSSKLVDFTITDGAINNLGLIPLSPDTGQFVVKTNPPGVAFEITDSLQKTTSGITPLTLDNMPSGKYQVKLKRPGWPEITEDVDLNANSSVNIQHSYQGTNVTLKSDPSGATIYFAGTALGKTPLTVNLPLAQVELTSKIGSLTPITQRFIPDANGNTVVEFKHTYGLLSVTCDRADADVVVGGVDVGKPPIEGILPPGRQPVAVNVEGQPEQTRTVDIRPGKRVAIQFVFESLPPNEADNTTDPEQTNAPVPRAIPAGTPFVQTPANPDDTVLQRGDMTTINATPAPSPAAKPTRSPRRSRVAATPVYRTKEDWEHARDQAYDKFDAQWDSKKKAMDQEKDYLDYWIDHSSGNAQEKLKNRKKALEDRMDHLDDEKDAAKQQLKHQWGDD
jgi:serine/threonine protein kinase